MTVPGRRAVAVVALAGAVLLGGAVSSPAAADNHDLVVALDQPGDGEVVRGSSVTVRGTVDNRAGLSLVSTEIDRIVVRVGDGPEVEVCRPCGGTPRPFSTTIAMPRNGTFRAQAFADGTRRLAGLGLTAVDGRGERTFGVAAPPRAPQDVKVEVSPERVVTISWARNTEPDLLHYLVRRKNRDGEAQVEQPRTGDRVSAVDRSTTDGGSFTYQVVAVRRGATENSSERSSTEKSVTVPAPPPSPGPDAGAPGGGGPGGAAGTGGDAAGAGGGQARVDISSFLAAQPGQSLPTPARELELPDTGFSSDLPFGARPPGEELEEGEEEAEARSLDVGTTTTEFVSRGRPLVPVAGGAILLLLAMHLRLLNQRVKAAPAVVSGQARTDLPHLPPDDDAEPAPPTPALFDYEKVAAAPPTPPPPPPADPFHDEVWSEEAWDEEEVWEVVSPAR